ncbi:YtfJ family protein [Flammeovirga kamogawensis]|uniref:YtfJ family protein n=1 Tax=Flammeovirga kamogawensis TaxID=373891 RepID=A0ABX8H1A7_9BACT|nr:YtfJ family protein [Flammeovirga kamogawensis]MBB6462645.1 hypothetical protein [Flammeovirga kamogawensis]QWG09611.1 YtfJ family protein [Flammeovirga kamogawensis]TRX65125.1 hypothetical protein EO216_21595 [Flammeovirga kamogawensis]
MRRFIAYINIVFIGLVFSNHAIGQKLNDKDVLQKGDVISAIEVRDLKNKPVMTPFIGEKVVMIFYADPDTPKANEYFVEKVKQWKFPNDTFLAYGIVNLKDTFYPNSFVRFLIRTIRKRSKREAGATILTDPEGIVQKEWNTGDSNNTIGVLVVDKTGEVLFWKGGELSKQETEEVINLLVDRLPQAKKLTEEDLRQFDLE